MTAEANTTDARDDAPPQHPTGRRAWELAKQEQTRRNLLDAATTVFLRDGYAKATVSAITAAAGVSQGSFYNYFRSREAVLLACVREAFDRERDTLSDPPDGSPRQRPLSSYADVRDRIERAHRTFFASYRANVQLLMLLDEAERVSPELRSDRQRVREEMVERDYRFIRTLQREGFADPSIDARLSAHALTGMVGRFAHQWFVLGGEFEEVEAVDTVTTLWLNALGVAPRRRKLPRT